jgi:superfamily II DNA/RNA helicase
MADYIHRCGRTGRVGSVEGCHVSNFIVGLKEVELVQKIEVCDFILTALFSPY